MQINVPSKTQRAAFLWEWAQTQTGCTTGGCELEVEMGLHRRVSLRQSTLYTRDPLPATVLSHHPLTLLKCVWGGGRGGRTSRNCFSLVMGPFCEGGVTASILYMWQKRAPVVTPVATTHARTHARTHTRTHALSAGAGGLLGEVVADEHSEKLPKLYTVRVHQSVACHLREDRDNTRACSMNLSPAHSHSYTHL